MTTTSTPAIGASVAEPATPPKRGARMGPRLRALLEVCPPDGPVADIGSGHGRLALELKRRDPGRLVYATELKPGPSAELRRLIGPDGGVRLLEGEGLTPLTGLRCRGVVIAGIGGETISRILERDLEIARSLAWLCLQPAQRSDRLRDWLERAGWPVLDYLEVAERGHLYPLFLVAPR